MNHRDCGSHPSTGRCSRFKAMVTESKALQPGGSDFNSHMVSNQLWVLDSGPTLVQSLISTSANWV